jgi:DNA-binding Lrp family transcriptional regulator
MRFNDLEARLGLSSQVLTRVLRQLERDGLIKRQLYAQVPVRVEYSLTPLGAPCAPSCRLCESGRRRLHPRSPMHESPTTQPRVDLIAYRDLTTLDSCTRVGLNRHSELRRRRISNHSLLEVEKADSGIPVRNLHLLVPIGSLGLLLLAEDEHKTLHVEPPSVNCHAPAASSRPLRWMASPRGTVAPSKWRRRPIGIAGQGDEMGSIEFDDAFNVLTPFGCWTRPHARRSRTTPLALLVEHTYARSLAEADTENENQLLLKLFVTPGSQLRYRESRAFTSVHV